MAKNRKQELTFDSLVFATPEQKLFRFLLNEPTTSFSPRVLSSKLKGVRGLGGAEGIMQILRSLETLKLIQFVDNNRAIILNNDSPYVQLMKRLAAICDLEGLACQIKAVSPHGVLHGTRAKGEYQSDDVYDLFVVTEAQDEVERIVGQHPLGKKIGLTVRRTEDFHGLPRKEPSLQKNIEEGFLMWGSGW